ncbi:MAG: succinate dehydrogenase, hydrophobic membrane anchor protein [Halioglobus sp.]|jgi:succinate dehydrogenase / fumarate reductase membrane anchor subunit|uniref:succinate dehydrogenase, hydrophobic membrane anchor protein n=1 Tax=Halioglobus sp. Uisw_031 TaxID=3230977 RepID=UPI0035914A8E|tara:strand:- start:365 stop:733 length:369 start_codon:yes stop_codon:yes gene_type:complete
MVTSATTASRTGLYDWFIQRVSAVILLAYVLVCVGWMLANSGFGYTQWSGLFAQTWMKVFSLLALVALAGHAWVGLWVVFTDYLTERMLGAAGKTIRLLAEGASVIIMLAYFVWGIKILWGL